MQTFTICVSSQATALGLTFGDANNEERYF